MSETFFSINDLSRRKLQTGLAIVVLALSVASTHFLLLLGGKIGFESLSITENRLTASFSSIFVVFIMLVTFLVLMLGVVIIYFMSFVMMAQRVKDIGLMKAAGCPSDLVFGYFMNELLIVSSIGCLLGIALGIAADYASVIFLGNQGFQPAPEPVNIWFALIIFGFFFVLSLAAGSRPIVRATKVEPARALSPGFSLGLSRESDFMGASRVGFTFKVAFRSLFRRRSATFRIVLCLIMVFVLVTVAVAGGLIADRTTKNWIEKAVGRGTVLVAHKDVCNQYRLLLSKFYQVTESLPFNYVSDSYLLPVDFLGQLNKVPGVKIDARLVMEASVKEVKGWTIDPSNSSEREVGDSREGKALIIGMEPEKAQNEWVMEGRLPRSDALEAIIGDSLAKRMFEVPFNQSIEVSGKFLDVVGVCLDPINNGNVTYVPLKAIQYITGISQPNALMIKISTPVQRSEALSQLRTIVALASEDYEVLELDEMLDKAVGFLGYAWSTIMLLPLFSLSGAALCLVGYVALSISEQQQEFGVLRAVGAKPKTIVKIIATQNLLVLISSCAVGIALGTIITLLVLIPDPIVSAETIVEISLWLVIATTVMFILSLLPALKFAKKPVLEIMTKS